MHQSLSESSGRPVNLEALFGRNASGAVYVLYSVHCKGAQSALATKRIVVYLTLWHNSVVCFCLST